MTLWSQVCENRIHRTHVLHVYHLVFSNCPNAKVCVLHLRKRTHSFLSLRTYAITEKSKWVAGFLYTIVIAELGVGLYMFIYAAAHPGQYSHPHQTWSLVSERNFKVESPTIPLDSFRLCFVPIASYLTILQISLSLGFGEHIVTLPRSRPGTELPICSVDVAIFVLVIAQTQNIRSRSPGMHVSSILNTVSRDAEIYFAVIASSHLMAVVMYSAARVGLFPPVLASNVL